jgi:predicted house-cleaning noncanonical NTP pyrophosphatase (MazG superfamily)
VLHNSLLGDFNLSTYLFKFIYWTGSYYKKTKLKKGTLMNIKNNRVGFDVNKLVRNRTKERREALGITYYGYILSPTEYKKELLKKLVEETQEVLDATNQENFITELADVLETIHALSITSGFTIKEVEERRQAIFKEREGFDKRCYCQYVELDESHPETLHYRQRPEKYPERHKITTIKLL